MKGKRKICCGLNLSLLLEFVPTYIQGSNRRRKKERKQHRNKKKRGFNKKGKRERKEKGGEGPRIKKKKE
jgi:hypothetical protein